MRKLLFTFSLTLSLLFGKGQTSKVTISGGGLKKTIEITDPQILSGMSAWSSVFLDTTRHPLEKAPAGRPYYEVSLYFASNANEPIKACVFFYSPHTATAPGVIYLPGEGAIWRLNVATIIRSDRDGKWSYAAPTWEAKIKPILDQAQTSVPEPAVASTKAHEITVDTWTKPQPGWLYVLDPHSESGHAGSRVWLYDPQNEKVMGSIRAGYYPDIALSQDGTHLYIASGERDSGELAMVDTATASVRHIPFPNRILYTPHYRTLPPFTSMTVSSDDRYVRILGHRVASPETVESEVFTVDTRDGHFSSSTVNIGDCSGGHLAPASTAGQFKVLCSWTGTAHSIRAAADLKEVSDDVVKLPDLQNCVSIGECRATWLAYPSKWPQSLDGNRVYVAYGSSTPDNMAAADQLGVFDTGNGRHLGSLQTSVPFWSVAASKDRSVFYASVPAEHSILAIDASTLRETRKLSVGTTPALAIVSP